MEYLSKNEMRLLTQEESLMAPRRRSHGRSCASVFAGLLVLGIAACGEKSAPEPPVKPVAPMIQPALPADAKSDDTGTVTVQPPAAPPVSPDVELASRVKAALGSERSINVHRIDVTSEGGVVTLYGTAENAQQRAKAEEVAAAVAGVRSVQNKLAIVAGS